MNWVKQNWSKLTLATIILFFGFYLSHQPNESANISGLGRVFELTNKEYPARNQGSPVLDVRRWFLSFRKDGPCLDLLEGLDGEVIHHGTFFADIANRIADNYDDNQCIQLTKQCPKEMTDGNGECVGKIVLPEAFQ